MKFGRFVVVTVFLVAIFFGVGRSLEADASGAPYIVRQYRHFVNSTCTLVERYWSNGDYNYVLYGSGCSAGPI